MEKATHMYDVLVKRRRDGIQKSVIAARFEVSTQAFDRLCSSHEPIAQQFPEAGAKAASLSESFSRLATWGHETGAQDQSLDYKLRKSKDLHEIVVQALTELQLAIEEGSTEKPTTWRLRLTLPPFQASYF